METPRRFWCRGLTDPGEKRRRLLVFCLFSRFIFDYSSLCRFKLGKEEVEIEGG